MKFEFFDHTADVLFRAYGANWRKVFEHAALALFEVLVDTERVRPEVEKVIELTSKRLDDLLVIWLEEILFHSEVDEMMFSEFRIEKLEEKNGEWKLEAIVLGEPINPDMHLRTEVKAVTHHELEIGEDKKGRKFAQVLIDI